VAVSDEFQITKKLLRINSEERKKYKNFREIAIFFLVKQPFYWRFYLRGIP